MLRYRYVICGTSIYSGICYGIRRSAWILVSSSTNVMFVKITSLSASAEAAVIVIDQNAAAPSKDGLSKNSLPHE
jgi:hypothetical protein